MSALRYPVIVYLARVLSALLLPPLRYVSVLYLYLCHSPVDLLVVPVFRVVALRPRMQLSLRILRLFLARPRLSNYGCIRSSVFHIHL